MREHEGEAVVGEVVAVERVEVRVTLGGAVQVFVAFQALAGAKHDLEKKKYLTESLLFKFIIIKGQ